MTRLIDTEPCGTLFVGARGFRHRAGQSTARTRRAVLGIEGESLTIRQVAERLSVSQEAAETRLRRERAKPGPVTWAGLRGEAA